MIGERFYVEAVDPEGEVYEDKSLDLLGSGEWPATYPTDEEKVTLHIGAADIDLNERELAWLVLQGGPALLDKLRSELRRKAEREQ